MRNWFYNFLWKSDRIYTRAKAFLRAIGILVLIITATITLICILMSIKVPMVVYYWLIVGFTLMFGLWSVLYILHWVSILFLKNFKEIKHKTAEHEVGHLVIQWWYYPNSVRKIELASTSKVIERNSWGTTELNIYSNFKTRIKANIIKGYNEAISYGRSDIAEALNIIFEKMKVSFRVKPLKEVEPIIKRGTLEDYKKLINMYLAGIIAEEYFKYELYNSDNTLIQEYLENFARNYVEDIFSDTQNKRSDEGKIKTLLNTVFKGQVYMVLIADSAYEIINIFVQKHENIVALKKLLIRKKKVYRRQFKKYL